MKTQTSVDKTTTKPNQQSEKPMNSLEPKSSLEPIKNLEPISIQPQSTPTTPINPHRLTNKAPNSDDNIISFQQFVEQKQAALAQYPSVSLTHQLGYRFINTKYPHINIFEDVAEPQQFEDLYAIQSLTNLRCKNNKGTLNLLAKDKIPHHIEGSDLACEPFTHINPDGSRFSNGQFGVMYLADSAETALAQVCFHQLKAWQNI